MQIIRYSSVSGDTALGLFEDGLLIGHFPSQIRLYNLLRLSASELRTQLDVIINAEQAEVASDLQPELLAPLDGETEVWGAGVTYKQSEAARKEESGTPDIYASIYSAQRPELFFKSTPRRVAGPDAQIVVRGDSTWNVPEPELALVINSRAEIIGYTICNDVSSRSIEGENPLYLPQAKIYARSCALGPGITPAWEVEDPRTLALSLRIERGGQTYWEGQANTSELQRSFEELVNYLFQEDEFPDGVILSTGTALIPERDFSLEQGDVAHITIDPLGTLSNPVVRGKSGITR